MSLLLFFAASCATQIAFAHHLFGGCDGGLTAKQCVRSADLRCRSGHVIRSSNSNVRGSATPTDAESLKALIAIEKKLGDTAVSDRRRYMSGVAQHHGLQAGAGSAPCQACVCIVQATVGTVMDVQEHFDRVRYFPPFNFGRINISNNCCNGFELPHGRQVNLSFWW